MQTILVTGGAGFIGSNFIPYFLEAHQDCKVINLDLLTYAGNLDNLREVENHSRYEFVNGDITNRELVKHLFDKHDIRGVIHFAAESHVDNSISDPEAFVRTNIHGTFTLLDVARRHWMNSPFEVKKGYEKSRFLHVSTDEVYGTLGETGLFEETTPYAPNSPYSASKAGSDMLVRSYFHTYGMNVVITNCSNNFGEKQHHEKLIPTIIRKAINEENIPIYGDGKNIRDWLYVLDHCKGIDTAFENGRKGESYNIGSNNEWNNIELSKKICSLLDKIQPRENGKYEDLITFVKDRPGHDRRYAIDSSKIESELSWKADTDFDTALTKTINWYINLYQQKETLKQKSSSEQPTTNLKQNENKTETPPPKPQQPIQNQSKNTNKVNLESKYQKVFEEADLDKSLEALAEVKAAIIRTRKDYEKAQEDEKDAENKAQRVIAKAQNGNLDWNEANSLAMELLKEQEKAKYKADNALQELAELAKLQDQLERHVSTVRNIRATQRVKMPDSTETISMIERMKSKIQKNEILGDLYGDVKSKGEDAQLDKRVNKALGIDPDKDALEALKKKLGMDK